MTPSLHCWFRFMHDVVVNGKAAAGYSSLVEACPDSYATWSRGKVTVAATVVVI